MPHTTPYSSFAWLVALACACCCVSSAETPSVAAPDPAAAFWAAYVKTTGNYDFHIQSIRNELTQVQEAKRPAECEAQVAALVEDCIGRIRDFEAYAVSQLSRHFDSAELQKLQTIYENAVLVDKTLELSVESLSEEALAEVQSALDSKVLEKFNEIRPELYDLIKEEVEPLLKYRNHDYRNRLFEILESYDPRKAYYGPLQPCENSKVLRFLAPPLPATAAYLEREGTLAKTLVLDSTDPNRRTGDRLTALLTHSDGESLSQWIAIYRNREYNRKRTAASS